MGLVRRTPQTARQPAGEVTTLELFFDLVFAFTITQLTAAQLHGGWSATGRSALLLLLLWWMYGGYAWLTNAAPPVTPRRRALLVLGMIGNFVTALSIPHAYGSDRIVFASGYLVVVSVHAGMFLTEAARVTRGMVVRLLGWNMLGAVLGLAGALFFEDVLAWWWLGSFVLVIVLPRLVGLRDRSGTGTPGVPSFELVPGHFVERHGLMLLIALGESVLAIGIGLGTGARAIGIAQVVFAVVSLLLAATLYWAYFGEDDARAEVALSALPPDRAESTALASYGYAFWIMLFGIVLTAAGLHQALLDPTAPLDWARSGELCGGVGAFWLGLGLFRRVLGLGGGGIRVGGAVALCGATVVGGWVSGIAALLSLLLGSVALLLLDRRLRSPSTAGDVRLAD